MAIPYIGNTLHRCYAHTMYIRVWSVLCFYRAMDITFGETLGA